VAPLASASRGTQEIALRADGRHLYVTDPRNDRVLVLDPSSLATVATLSGPRLDAPFGIVLSGGN
jgi:YVTN family beta-propeller protein